MESHGMNNRSQQHCQDDARLMDPTTPEPPPVGAAPPLWQVLARSLVRAYLRYFPLRNGKGRVYRALQARLLPPERWVTVPVRQGFRLRLDLTEPAQRQIYFFGEHDGRQVLRLLARILLPGDSFWDVGANIGYFALTAAKWVGPQGRVVAFEPATPAWEALTVNIGLNALENIRLEHLALSDRPGAATPYRRGDYADGDASLIPRDGYHQHREVVATVSLDDYLAQTGAPPPTFLKVDVGSHEGKVLRGGQGLLTGSRAPILLVKMNDSADLGPWLQAAGYQGCYLRRGRWHFADRPDLAPSRNMLWLRPDIPWHRERLLFIGLCPCKLFGSHCQD